MKDYSEQLAAGSQLLNAGQDEKALDAFLCIEASLSNERTAELMQLIGICQRKLGKHDAALHAFTEAFNLATDNCDKGRILRDKAMVWLTQRNFDEAIKCLDESLSLLSRVNAVEYAVTMGFIGRVHAWQGDKEFARSYFRTADLVLKRPDVSSTYELNNLVHWLEVESFPRRIKLAYRAWPLAVQDGNRKRLIQIALLVVCPPLARCLARR